MVVAFAPIVAFLLGVADIAMPWQTLLLSVLLYVALPLAAGLWTRRRLDSPAAIDAFKARVKSWSVVGLERKGGAEMRRISRSWTPAST